MAGKNNWSQPSVIFYAFDQVFYQNMTEKSVIFVKEKYVLISFRKTIEGMNRIDYSTN